MSAVRIPGASAACGRRGFTLAEVIVAAVLVSVGLLAVVATANHARARLRIAAVEERVTRAAALTLDSLRAAADGATHGASERDGLRLEWEVDAAGVVALTIRFADGHSERDRHYSTRHAGGAP